MRCARLIDSSELSIEPMHVVRKSVFQILIYNNNADIHRVNSDVLLKIPYILASFSAFEISCFI